MLCAARQSLCPPADPYRPAVGQHPERLNSTNAGRGRRGQTQAMIAIDIFKENHRSSEQTRHPGLDSVVGAANLAAAATNGGPQSPLGRKPERSCRGKSLCLPPGGGKRRTAL